ncbi:MAG TPA: Hint domain-containing protein, partial [Kofleriaceae bacterium]
CYTPDQSLRFSTGDVNILDAFNALRDDVVTLSSDATLNNPKKQVSRVYSYTREIRDVEQPIFKVTTQSGGSLSVTNEHPILVSNGHDGRLVKAEKIHEGDRLVKADGTPDPVVHIEKTTFFGKVYNIKPAPEELVSNILIAQGFLVGSARFQNDDIMYMNRSLLFRSVPDDVMPK